ncbi:Os09g0541400 [Oryza sativa Japonica Group]|uniref:Uncharacterized protein n=2 Tax=Oryza sativa subsp. japonica TaxID=39947 RepID=Q651C8_ORYSJ|nr:hypothetical protein DAI22_09g182200 [Oryza sativa Japonica Group]BAC79190.1 hypothetical protein [Oryza sativa Japonica Group]BAD46589.1 hypothetical protein [Oryza sativa Japonica Group]BAT09205.1 Os09g0541400 [Oryza sativa Japonica Group]
MARRKMKAMVKRKMKAMGKKKPKVPMKKTKAQRKKQPKASTKMLETPAPAPAPAVVGAFTACELFAAKRLVLLSGSNKSSSGGSRSAIFASSGSSVNAPPVIAQVMPRPSEDYLSDEELEDDSQEVPGIPRRTRLYRYIFEIYQVTQPMKK